MMYSGVFYQLWGFSSDVFNCRTSSHWHFENVSLSSLYPADHVGRLEQSDQELKALKRHIHGCRCHFQEVFHKDVVKRWVAVAFRKSIHSCICMCSVAPSV
ncbi:hypothetical protein I7I48_05219 [Histoplasma ohiense]|nr:hypothetical protein I7I48_05219 [Histoplasma ohiense (nom. inval.)]